MAQSMDDLLGQIFNHGRFTGTSGKGNGQSKSSSETRPSHILTSEELRKQAEEMELLNQQIMADIEEMSHQLDQDAKMDQGLLPSNKTENTLPKANSFEEPDPKEAAVAFQDLLPLLRSEIIGQDEFLNQLILGFKRPYIMGTEPPLPRNVILVQGDPGTGKHTAIRLLSHLLYKNKVFPSEEIPVVDLALYPTPSEQKLFLQDLYVALQSGSSVIVFDHMESCHTTFLQSLNTLAATGSLPLSTRYVLQKGILVEAGGALTSENIASLKLNGQILLFVTSLSQSKVAGLMGSSFIDNLGDIAKTGRFMTKDLIIIAQKQLARMAKKCLEQLDFTVNFPSENDDLPRYYIQFFSDDAGVKGILSEVNHTYRAFAQLRLNQSEIKPLQMTLSCKNNQLYYELDGESHLLYELLPESYKGELDAVKAEMDQIVGLDMVKDYVLSLEENIKVQQMREKEGMKVERPSMHMIFTGNPGTGKTTIARIVGKYLKAIGALSSGHLVEVTRADLVGRYVGHTAPLTTQVVKSALGGVLFIDEAYSLYREQNDSFGLEAIDTLVKCIEDYRNELVVILAGYTNEMQVFLSSNSGLASRFPNIIEFPDYTGKELLEITKSIAASKQYRISPEAEKPLLIFYDTIQELNAKESGNGRLARNKVEEAILNQSRRILKEGIGELDLLTITDFELDLPENQ